ncbi:MAG: hypothetical protein HW380_1804 [Magnetococcales bacterium]|nr:hypothetical protein [Magnetococcales bacterium]
MKKLIPVFVAMFVGVGFAGAVSAAETAPAADPAVAACTKQADEKKLAGDEAKKFIDECVKGGGK